MVSHKKKTKTRYLKRTSKKGGVEKVQLWVKTKHPHDRRKRRKVYANTHPGRYKSVGGGISGYMGFAAALFPKALRDPVDNLVAKSKTGTVGMKKLAKRLRRLATKNTDHCWEHTSTPSVKRFVMNYALTGTKEREDAAKRFKKTGEIDYHEFLRHAHKRYHGDISNRHFQKKRQAIPTGYHVKKEYFEATFEPWSSELVDMSIAKL